MKKLLGLAALVTAIMAVAKWLLPNEPRLKTVIRHNFTCNDE